MTELLLLLFVVAIGVGWFLGRASVKQKTIEVNHGANREYYRGLNFLLNEQPDNALDAFIDSLEVNSETLETHLAIGNLLRRKGEVDRAIRVHQNLLARPSLLVEQANNARLELARDFIAAGVFDRAERLLLDLSQDAPELATIAKRHLLEIYQDEKEWRKAIKLALDLKPKKSLLRAVSDDGAQLAVAIGNYYCELAEIAINNSQYQEARRFLSSALDQDKTSVRASLLLAQLDKQTNHVDRAIKQLRAIRQQQPEFISEVIKPIKACFQAKGDRAAYRAFLKDSLESYPMSIAVVLALGEEIEEQDGAAAAANFLAEQLQQKPSMRALRKYLELEITDIDPETPIYTNFSVVEKTLNKLQETKPRYRCGQCGFSGKQVHWQCPSCRQWGKIKPIRGVEGD